MTRNDFDAYCKTLTAATHVIQWRNASVWKVGGKIFTIAPQVNQGDYQLISFKCSDLSYDILREQPGIIPAPYLARANWVQLVSDQAMSDEDIRLYLNNAYDIIVAKLTKAARSELGL